MFIRPTTPASYSPGLRQARRPQEDVASPLSRLSTSAPLQQGARGQGAEGVGSGQDLGNLLAGFGENGELNQHLPLYQDMYFYDSVCGSAVDLMSNIPFGDFTLRGVPASQQRPFLESIERLKLHSLLPDLVIDFLVLGCYISSLIFDRQAKVFVDSVPHNLQHCTVHQLPFYSEEPVISVKFPAEMQKSLTASETRLRDLRKRFGNSVIDRILSGQMDLDPFSTIYMPRRTLTGKYGISWLRRALPLWLYEKNIFRGTLAESVRRQRPITVIQMGDTEWEPRQEDYQSVTQMVIDADQDPLGAVIALRQGISFDEIRSTSDLWKVDDVWNSTVPAKLRALGLGESFLTGDQQFDCVVGSTLIPTERGLLPIERLHPDAATATEKTSWPLDLRVQGARGMARASYLHYVGVAPTVLAGFSNGQRLQGTPHHRVRCLRQHQILDVNLADLQPGDLVEVSSHATYNRQPTNLLSQEAVASGRGLDLSQVFTWPTSHQWAWLAGAQQHAEATVSQAGETSWIIKVEHERGQKLVALLNHLGVTAQLSLKGSVYLCPQEVTRYMTGTEPYTGLPPDEAEDRSYLPAEWLADCLCPPHQFPTLRKYGRLYYREYRAGAYGTLLAAVKEQLGQEVSEGLQQLLKEPRQWAKVTFTVPVAAPTRVYDLTMDEEEAPYYVANTIVTHNTSTTNLNSFLEGIRSFRTRITRDLLQDKLFPLIAITNDLWASTDKKKEAEKTLSGRQDLSTQLNLLKNTNSLLIPSVDWDKQLRPEGDSSYFDMLDRLTEKGVPVPLRMMAAACGLNFDKLLSGMKEDLEARKKLSEFQKQVAKLAPQDMDSLSAFVSASAPDAETGEAAEAFAPTYASAVLNRLGHRPSILNREWGESGEIVGQTATGKPRYIHNQRLAQAKANDAIIRTLKEAEKK